MNKTFKEQEVTATLTATETATMPHLTIRSGTANFSVRYRPPVEALGAFKGRKEIWKTTGTSDKKIAEKVAMRILVELQDEAELYTSTFIPWLSNQVNGLGMNERSQLALRVSTGYEWEEFKKNLKTAKETMALQYSLMGLPMPSEATQVAQIMRSGAASELPQWLPPPLMEQSLPEATAPAISSPKVQASQRQAAPTKRMTNKAEDITVEVVAAVFKFAAETRKASVTSEKMRAREGLRLIDWMNEKGIIALNMEDAAKYITFLRKGVSLGTAQTRFSLVRYPFSVAIKSGHTANLKLPFDPFEKCGIISAVGEGIETPREEISGKDFRTILANLPSATVNAPMHWAVRLSAVTGMRVSALAGLRFNEIRKDAGIVCLQVKAREGTKTNIDYWVPVHNKVADEFYAWFLEQQGEPTKRVFKKEGRIISSEFSTLLKKLGIKPEDETHQITFHSLRHSNTSWLNGLGIPTAHANAMQGRKEGGSLGKYGSLAGVRTYANGVVNAPLWYDEDYLERLAANTSTQWK